MRSFFVLLLTVSLSLAAAAAPEPEPEPDDPTKADSKKVQGSWQLTRASKDGNPADKDTTGVAAEVSKDVITIKTGNRDEPAKFVLNAKKKPKEIDIIAGKGDERKLLGIYKLEKDEWTICLADKGKPRPTSFDEKSFRFLVFKRKNKAE